MCKSIHSKFGESSSKTLPFAKNFKNNSRETFVKVVAPKIFFAFEQNCVQKYVTSYMIIIK
jgi:hypothetical protein